jgi:4-aminobutyrate aminotransferase-like enzyme
VIGDIRGRGAMMAIELVTEPGTTQEPDAGPHRRGQHVLSRSTVS